MSEFIQVEVAYALPHEQTVLSLRVAEGSTAELAIMQSGILKRFPEIDLKTCKIGIFGKAGKLDVILHNKDRVEIYRPLIADPKEVRKKRAAAGKDKKPADDSTGLDAE